MTDPASPAPWNSARWSGALWSAACPLAAALIGNGLIFTFGTMGDPNYAATPLAPPGWVVGLVWTVVYPLWGLARWRAWVAGGEGPDAARWVVALIVWGLLYPVGALVWTTDVSAVANVLSLLLAAVTTWRVARVSRGGAALMTPSLIWLCFASYLGFAAARWI